MEKNLQKVGLEGTGVRGVVDTSWDELKNCHAMNLRGLESEGGKPRRSELTTGDSLNLYFSYFAAEDVMADKELQYMLNEGEDVGETDGSEEKKDPGSASLEDTDTATPQPLPQSTAAADPPGPRRTGVRDGFEQINDDLYARRANKFMVFNGVGMDTWVTKATTKPGLTARDVRKVLGIED